MRPGQNVKHVGRMTISVWGVQSRATMKWFRQVTVMPCVLEVAYSLIFATEEADSAFSHSPSPSLPRRIRPRHPRLSSPSRLPTSIDSESHCVPAHNRTVPPPVTDAPPNGSSVLFGTDNDTLCPTFHLAPDARLLHSSLSVGPFAYSPALRPGLSADYRIPLSLTTSTSHVRTRPSYDTED